MTAEKKKLLKTLAEAMVAAPKRAGDDPMKQAGFVLHRLEEAGYDPRPMEACGICGAHVVLMAGHMAWHERARTHHAVP